MNTINFNVELWANKSHLSFSIRYPDQQRFEENTWDAPFNDTSIRELKTLIVLVQRMVDDPRISLLYNKNYILSKLATYIMKHSNEELKLEVKGLECLKSIDEYRHHINYKPTIRNMNQIFYPDYDLI